MKNYISNTVGTGNNTRIGLVEFGKEGKVKTSLTSDSNMLLNSLNEIKLQVGVCGSNMHDGVCKAIEVLKESNAQNKMLVIVSDGRTNRIVTDLDTHNRERSRMAVKEELNKAKNEMNQLKIMTVGYCKKDDVDSHNFLRDMATENLFTIK